MADNNQPQNRKQRRAVAKDTMKKTPQLDQSDMDFKLKQPDRSGPKGKTLYELAEERRELLAKGQPFEKTEHPAKAQDGDFMFNDDPLGPGGEAILYASSLSMLHFTLDVLVYNQYRQEIIWSEIFRRVATVFPVLILVVYMLHSQTASRFPLLKQLLFFGTSVAAGCYMIFSGNTRGYFAVMKRAPPVGTLWVWSVIEMQLPYAVASVVAVLGYLWWNGFKAF
ncbi:hypothetical protein H2201_008494 [Coniosporium apollinis]|uniref:DUF7719 domain-containing protein n=1 Tax=Coniosporium apollinis TaxID=61459 RepID=A0ABQ9NJ97_9PEZI|nr:hypothetical protein H2201_008494 [Coniosporium apollinis]